MKRISGFLTFIKDNNKHVFYIFPFILLANCSSISTQTKQYHMSDENLKTGKFAELITQTQTAKGKQYKEKDKVLYYLDIGMLYHWQGEYEKSNEYLEKAEQGIEELYTKSIQKMGGSFLLNDNTLDYYGEDYEDIYTNIFKALNYIHLNNRDAAFVELNRVHQKLNMLEDKYVQMESELGAGAKKASSENNSNNNQSYSFKKGKTHFYDDVFARYLGILLYLSESEFDNAEIEKNKIFNAFKEQVNVYDFNQPKLPIGDKDRKETYLDVLAFVGKSPQKYPADYNVRTLKDKIVISSNSPVAFREEFSFPVSAGGLYKFSVPYIQKRPTIVSSVEVFVNNKLASQLELIESVENISVEVFKIKAPLLYTRAAVRMVIKGIISEIAKNELKKEINDPLLGALAGFAAQTAVNATENADLRLSRYFPAKVYKGRIAVNPGVHNIEIRYIDNNGVVINKELFSDILIGKKLNLLETKYLN
jgi:uncharacterized protein